MNFKKCYQPGTNMGKDDNGDPLAESHSILINWKNCFYQLFNMELVMVGKLNTYS
jgi:hypothetical protein